MNKLETVPPESGSGFPFLGVVIGIVVIGILVAIGAPGYLARRDRQQQHDAFTPEERAMCRLWLPTDAQLMPDPFKLAIGTGNGLVTVAKPTGDKCFIYTDRFMPTIKGGGTGPVVDLEEPNVRPGGCGVIVEDLVMNDTVLLNYRSCDPYADVYAVISFGDDPDFVGAGSSDGECPGGTRITAPADKNVRWLHDQCIQRMANARRLEIEEATDRK